MGVEHSFLLSSSSEAVGKGTDRPPALSIRVGRVIPPLSQAVPAWLKTADQYFLHTLLSTEHECDCYVIEYCLQCLLYSSAL